MAKRGCCLCNNPIDAKNAPILTLGAAGWPRMICDDCDKRIVTASTAKTYEEIEAACRALGDGMVVMRVEDSAVIETVNGIIESSMQRAEQIKDGSYDFSLDEAEEAESSEDEVAPDEADAADGEDGEGDTADGGEEFDIPEELRETEEDRALDEAEAKQSKVLDTVVSWTSALIFLGAVIFFIVKFVF